MSKNEVAISTGYTALKDFNLADAMSAELGGMDISFDRVTIPAAGGTAFELPGELPGETDMAKEFTGVILFHHPMFTYYRERFSGGSNPPDCGSYDGVTGSGNPGGSCAHCPLNQFGSGENGGKACKNKRRIYILREGELIPILLTLPTGSMKEFAVYIKRLLAKGRKSSAVVTRFSLKKVSNAGGIAYTETNSPKSVMRQAFATGMIADDEGWSAILRARNIASHLYSEEQGHELYNQIVTTFLPLFDALERETGKRLNH